jgi:hypothetical protein
LQYLRVMIWGLLFDDNNVEKNKWTSYWRNYMGWPQISQSTVNLVTPFSNSLGLRGNHDEEILSVSFLLWLFHQALFFFKWKEKCRKLAGSNTHCPQ